MCIFVQDYVETAEQIDCPALLPESPANDLLTKMLVPAPYQAPEKKAKKSTGAKKEKAEAPAKTTEKKPTTKKPAAKKPTAKPEAKADQTTSGAEVKENPAA